MDQKNPNHNEWQPLNTETGNEPAGTLDGRRNGTVRRLLVLPDFIQLESKSDDWIDDWQSLIVVAFS